jgi:bile acid-coenzyme A ligase
MESGFGALIDANGQPANGAPFGALLTAQAQARPDAPAVTVAGQTMSFAALDRAANRRARWLAGQGVAQDDIVLLALPNGLAYYECAFAVWKLGATPGHVSYRLALPEIAAIIELARPALVLGERGPAGMLVPEPLPDSLPDTPLAPLAARHGKISTSGGSTGRPKLIVDPNPAVWGPDKEGRHRKPYSVIVNPAPLYHSAPFGLMLPALAQGSHIIEAGRFDPEQYLALVDRYRANWAYLVPTMMARIAHLPPAVLERYDVSCLECVLHMAAPCPAWVKRFWIDFLGPEKIWEVYGGTERFGATMIGGAEWLAHPGSVGCAPPGIDLAIFDEAGDLAPAGAVGEIFFRYAEKRPEFSYIGATPRKLGDWTSFGDMGWLDAAGYLFIADRRTDMVVSGGVNFYPAEIEAAIDAYPGVYSSVVFGLPDPDLGQILHAVVQVAPTGTAVTEAALREFLAGRLAPPKHPRGFDLVSEPVRDEAGKVRRSAWRDRWLARTAEKSERLQTDG